MPQLVHDEIPQALIATPTFATDIETGMRTRVEWITARAIVCPRNQWLRAGFGEAQVPPHGQARVREADVNSPAFRVDGERSVARRHGPLLTPQNEGTGGA